MKQVIIGCGVSVILASCSLFGWLDPVAIYKTGQLSGVEKLTLVDNLLYVADGHSGLYILDISNPLHPIKLGAYDTPGYVIDVAVSGDYAYVVDKMKGLHIIDVSDPTTPTSVGFLTGQILQVEVNSDFIYLTTVPIEETAEFNTEMKIIDGSKPTKPKEVGVYNKDITQITVKGQYAYVTGTDIAGYTEFRILDISTPMKPVEIGSLGPINFTSDLAVVDDYVYLAYGDGVNIIDISDPTNPVQVGSYEVRTGITEAVDSDGQYIYISNLSNVQIVDISNLNEPVLLGTYDNLVQARDLVVSDGYFYVGEDDVGEAGVYIFESPHQ